MAAGSGRQDESQTDRDAVRQQRLAQALRDNLKRRKAQVRGRAGGEPRGAADRVKE